MKKYKCMYYTKEELRFLLSRYFTMHWEMNCIGTIIGRNGSNTPALTISLYNKLYGIIYPKHGEFHSIRNTSLKTKIYLNIDKEKVLRAYTNKASHVNKIFDRRIIYSDLLSTE